MDPKAAKYNFQSPYAYAENNPVTKIDVNGEGSGGDKGKGGTKPKVHTVEKGETLSGIAKANNTSVDKLRKINNLDRANDRDLQVGTKLSIQSSGTGENTMKVNSDDKNYTNKQPLESVLTGEMGKDKTTNQQKSKKEKGILVTGSNPFGNEGFFDLKDVEIIGTFNLSKLLHILFFWNMTGNSTTGGPSLEPINSPRKTDNQQDTTTQPPANTAQPDTNADNEPTVRNSESDTTINILVGYRYGWRSLKDTTFSKKADSNLLKTARSGNVPNIYYSK